MSIISEQDYIISSKVEIYHLHLMRSLYQQTRVSPHHFSKKRGGPFKPAILFLLMCLYHARDTTDVSVC